MNQKLMQGATVKIVVKNEGQTFGCRGKLMHGATLVAETRLYPFAMRDQAHAAAEALAQRRGWRVAKV